MARFGGWRCWGRAVVSARLCVNARLPQCGGRGAAHHALVVAVLVEDAQRSLVLLWGEAHVVAAGGRRWLGHHGGGEERRSLVAAGMGRWGGGIAWGVGAAEDGCRRLQEALQPAGARRGACVKSRATGC